MSKKYIKQIDSQNFVYPNNNLAEYDIEIIHEINNNPISGSVVSLSAVTATSSSITFDLDYTWVANGAELYVNPSGNTNLVAVYMMAPNQEYFKPFRCVGYATTGSTGSSITSLLTFTVTPADMGLTIFENGTYQFEVRFIGRKSVLPICYNVNISSIVGPTPTPTVTPTLTKTVTPTPTPSSGFVATPTPTPTVTPSQGGSYDYYTIDIYSCFPCNFIGTGIARSTSTLTIGNFYTIADGNAYYVTNTTIGPSYDVDLSGSVSGPSCNYVCSI